ncbi:glycosyltransferase family 2 protein [Lysinibacillus sp. BPa_S21]|uniref:tetratricopeptide repeat-containing glycosyltransferase family 2 protein n=1 Tax=Lysinibacillus sp. BPa_S21 TaxID=2932478 RepID=UPI00201359A5|nr:glycosyltransferase family 2 protein [Lysinibacillus sp. BPa_S21]MCL1698247.1 glycosyltransferase [Lysinibacillus sp. BPa_S21]
MITISLCMIVKNEEDVLGRCLQSVKDIVDEIIIVDTGSTDNTKEIAKKFDAHIDDFEWCNDFSKARNYSFNLAKKDYILWLDADDVIEETEQLKLLKLKEILSEEVDAVSMPYILSVNESGDATYQISRHRLVKRKQKFTWIGKVHEYLAVYGNIVHSDVAIQHKKEKVYTDRNLQIYMDCYERGEYFSPRDIFYFGNELLDHKKYEKAIKQYQAFLDSNQGWVEDNINACINLSKCYGQLNDKNSQLKALLRTLEFTKPIPKFCCFLGDILEEKGDIDASLYWYLTSIQMGKPNGEYSVLEPQYWTWYPHLQLCVLYYRLGNIKRAKLHNEIAKYYAPEHPSVIFNDRLFNPQQEKNELPVENILANQLFNVDNVSAENELENVMEKETTKIHQKRKLKILIGSPIKQDSDILTHFLQSLNDLEKNSDIQLHYFFFDDNDDKASKKLLKDFSNNRDVTIIETTNQYEYIKDDITHHWTSNNVQHVSYMKNHILNYSKENNFDYVFLIDSDLILHPKTLTTLINANKDIISNIFWTKWTPDSIEMPQVWLQDEYQLFTKEVDRPLSENEMQLKTLEFILKMRAPGIYKVGGLGACTLIGKKAIHADVNFNKIDNISYAGEDRHFCIRAAVLGFSLYVETTYPAFHIYRRENLKELEQWKSKNSLQHEKGECQ